MAKFDFTKTFEKIGTQFVRGLRDGIVKQRGLDGGSYPPPTQATLEIRKQKKGKKGTLKSSSSTKRMYVTGDTAREGFSFIAKPNGLSVFALGFPHKNGEATYSEIIRDNSRGLPGQNVNIKESNKPLIFPSRPDEIKLMKKEFEMARLILQKDANEQLNKAAKTNIKVVLNIG